MESQLLFCGRYLLVINNMSNRGFTLVETLIYIAIIGGIVVSFVSFALNISKSRQKTFVAQEVQANARFALETISRAIQSGSGINKSASVFDSDQGKLSVVKADVKLNPTVINLSADNGVLQIKEGDSPVVPITSGAVRVINLSFSDLSSGSARENIKIDLTVGFVTSSDTGSQYSQSLETAVSVRE